MNKSCIKGTAGNHLSVSAIEIKGRLEMIKISDPRNIMAASKLNDLT